MDDDKINVFRVAFLLVSAALGVVYHSLLSSILGTHVPPGNWTWVYIQRDCNSAMSNFEVLSLANDSKFYSTSPTTRRLSTISPLLKELMLY